MSHIFHLLFSLKSKRSPKQQFTFSKFVNQLFQSYEEQDQVAKAFFIFVHFVFVTLAIFSEYHPYYWITIHESFLFLVRLSEPISYYDHFSIQNGEILQFYNLEESKRIPIDEFAYSSQQDRVTHDDNVGIWYESEYKLPEITLDEVMAGFNNDLALTVRLEALDERGQKIILTREEAEIKMSSATRVVKGDNLIRNEYGNRLFADFFLE